MSHLNDNIAEFVFDELSAAQRAEAVRHLAECASCREQVEQFEHTLHKLKATPELDLPRDIVFESERPRAGRFWRWLPATAAIAALLLVTIALAGRVHIQWHDSQLTIAFGQSIPTAQPDQTAALTAELQRVKGYLAYLDSQQQRIERDNFVIASRIPAARAQGSPTGD